MPTLWKVNEHELETVKSSTLVGSHLKENSLEEWIRHKPEILGEPLLIIGKQVRVAGIDNRIDLLALDSEGRLTVIEVKRDSADVPADFQALRYVAAIADWSYEQIKNEAEKYLRSLDPDSEPHFPDVLDQFSGNNLDLDDLNEDQRIIIVARSVHERLIAVADWLTKHKVDVKVVEVALFADGKNLLVSPKVVVPIESIGGHEAGEVVVRPWDDGKKWHLEERCSTETAKLMENLAEKVPAIVTTEGVSWNQKHYVAVRLHGRNWITVETRPNLLIAAFHIAPNSFKAGPVAKMLGVVVFNHEKPLADRLGTPSSVDIEHRESQDVVLLRIKPDFKFNTPGFAKFVKLAHQAALS